MPELRIAVIPAAGRASRVNGIPKFLFPIQDDKSLIEYHVDFALEYADLVLIGCRAEHSKIILDLVNSDRTKVQVLKTKTMTETIKNLVAGYDVRTLTLQMPDTYVGKQNVFSKTENLSFLTSKNVLGIWNTRDDQRGRFGQVESEIINGEIVIKNIVDKDPVFHTGKHWGGITFYKPQYNNWDSDLATIGSEISKLITNKDLIPFFSESEYFDLGTPKEIRDFYSFINF